MLRQMSELREFLVRTLILETFRFSCLNDIDMRMACGHAILMKR